MSNSEDDDVLAAEFVLGTLDVEERAQADLRLRADSAFRQAVAEWDDRLSPLLDLCDEVEPPSTILPLLINRLKNGRTPTSEVPSATIITLTRSLRRWRSVASGALALAAALVGWIVLAPQQNQGGRFVAVLQKDANSPAILLSVDVGARRAIIRPVSTNQPADKSYELWLINPEVGAPHSLGVLQAKGATNASLAPFDSAVIARATYAITIEAPGGSPTGAPSGPPILSGRLVDEAH